MIQNRLYTGILALTLALGGAAVFGISNTAATAAPVAPQAAKVAPEDLTGTWKADKNQGEIGFSVIHLGVAKTRGRFKEFEVTFQVDGVKQEKSSVEAVIQTASIDTGNANRDNHLRNKDFFDAPTYPTITFKSTAVKKSRGGEYICYGDLTMHGVTRPISLKFKPSTPVKGPGGKLRSGLTTKITVDRRDYGLTWNNVVEGVQAVSHEVEISLDLGVVKQ
jgi:polyisoprenoid-binding protein YceI